MIVIRINRRFFSDFVERNKIFMKKVNKYNNNINQHTRVKDITQEQADKFVSKLSKEEVAARIVNQSKYDKQFKNYISDFNSKHKGQVSLLDFSNYATTFGQLRDGPIKKSDMEVIQEFQKRKVDQRVHQLRKRKLEQESPKRNKKEQFQTHYDDPFGYEESDLFPWTRPQSKAAQSYNDSGEQTTFPVEGTQKLKRHQLKQGPFFLKDDFVMLLLHRGVSTKVTTLNRLNYYRTLVFMGNGNGVISYGKGRSDTPQGSLQKAIDHCKSNLIAIPLDQKCTLPKPIAKRFQDYRLYLRPLPGFNSWGHPTMSTMLSLTGFAHMGFKTVHTSKNVYDLVNVYLKTVTQNTTPQQLAQNQGFKVYRHQFIRPLTKLNTHRELSY